MKDKEISLIQAKKEVFPVWVPFIRKEIRRLYFEEIKYYIDVVKRDRVHQKIMDTKRKIEREEDNEDWEEDLKQAIKRKKFAIQKASRLRDEDVYGEEDGSDDGSDDESDDEDKDEHTPEE